MKLLFIHGVNTEDEVLIILKEAQALLRNGALVVNQWSSEGTSVTKFNGMRIADLIEGCIAFLQQENPDVYGRRITRTKPAFN